MVAAESTEDSHEMMEVKNQNWDGLLCALGIILPPMTGTVYGVVRCIVKTGAEDVWSCKEEDLTVTLTTMATLTIGFCLIDPIWW